MTTPAVWKPGVHSRSAGNTLSVPYTVLNIDGFDRKAIPPLPTCSGAIYAPPSPSSGRATKALHVWFHSPSAAALQSLRDVAPSLGLDAGLIGHPDYP